MEDKNIAIKVILWFALATVLVLIFDSDETIVIILAMALALIPFVLAAIAKEKKAKKAKEAEEAKALSEEKHFKESVRSGDPDSVLKFYNMCLEQGVRNADSSGNQQRIVLLAQNNGITGTGDELVRAYNKGKAQVEDAEQKRRMARARAEERDKLRISNKYTDLFGRDKRIRICEDKIAESAAVIAECERTEGRFKAAGETLYRTASGREISWAAAGGAAAGLAGGAAGLATAIDVQNRNAAVRAQNDALARQIAEADVMVTFAMADKERAAKSEIESWDKKLQKAKISLMSDAPAEELMKLLPIETLEKRVCETGSVLVKARVRRKTLTIFDDVTAVIDGSVKVIIRSGEKTVAEGIFALPFCGTLNDYSFEVICPAREAVPSNFTVEYQPNRLWAIEEIW